MKKLEFETSKGKFVLMDFPLGKKNVYMNKSKGISLKEITEEQASEIVDFEDGCRLLYGYAKNKLHSLLKSKGIHLFENPYKGIFTEDNPTSYEQAEQKTFYNPYIFKL